MVGDGCAGPPKPSICSDHSRHSAASASTGGLLGPLAGMLGADLRAAHPITKNAPSRWATHEAITAALAAAGNAIRI